MLSARTLAWRTACWALGAVSVPGSAAVTSGTAAASPAAHACVVPSTVSWAVHFRRPRSFSGRSVAARIGCGFTPAVHTTVRVGKRAPSLRTATRSSQESRRVSRRTSMLRRRSWLTVYLPISSPTSGRMRFAGLDEDPLHVVGLDVVVVPRGVAGHVLQLAEGLHSGVTAAYEDEGQGGVADRGVAGGGGDVHLLDDVVAQPDGLFDGLEADAVLGESGDREGAGDGAGGQHEFVVRDLDGARALLLGGEGGEGRGALGVVDGRGLADDDAALVEDAAQRHDDVTR